MTLASKGFLKEFSELLIHCILDIVENINKRRIQWFANHFPTYIQLSTKTRSLMFKWINFTVVLQTFSGSLLSVFTTLIYFTISQLVWLIYYLHYYYHLWSETHHKLCSVIKAFCWQSIDNILQKKHQTHFLKSNQKSSQIQCFIHFVPFIWSE